MDIIHINDFLNEVKVEIIRSNFIIALNIFLYINRIDTKQFYMCFVYDVYKLKLIYNETT